MHAKYQVVLRKSQGGENGSNCIEADFSSDVRTDRRIALCSTQTVSKVQYRDGLKDARS